MGCLGSKGLPKNESKKSLNHVDNNLNQRNEIGKEAKNGYDEETKNVKIIFVKKEADNPKINALLIVRGTLKDTDYDEYQREQELMEKQKQEFDKKNREFQRMSKSIDFEDFEDDFTDDGKKYRVSNGFFSGSSIFVTLIAIGFVYFFFFSGKR